MQKTIVRSARVLFDVLSDKGSADAASMAAALAIDQYEEASGRFPPEQDCREGCHFCCHLYVSAHAPEVFLLARVVGRSFGKAAAAVAARAGSLTAAERLEVREPCSLLYDRSCVAYSARPICCRYFVSPKSDLCKAWWSGGNLEIGMPSLQTVFRSASSLALKGALKMFGRPFRSYEINSALAVVLREKHAEKRWLAGEDLFAGVPMDEGDRARADYDDIVKDIAYRAVRT